jgi:hypothetical protein
MSRPTSDTSLPDCIDGFSHTDRSTDRVNSIVNTVVRGVYDGKRAVAVGTDTRTQIDGLLDLVDLHLNTPNVVGETEVDRDEVVYLLLRDDWDSEAEGALRTLASQLRAPFGSSSGG